MWSRSTLMKCLQHAMYIKIKTINTNAYFKIALDRSKIIPCLLHLINSPKIHKKQRTEFTIWLRWYNQTVHIPCLKRTDLNTRYRRIVDVFILDLKQLLLLKHDKTTQTSFNESLQKSRVCIAILVGMLVALWIVQRCSATFHIYPHYQNKQGTPRLLIKQKVIGIHNIKKYAYTLELTLNQS